MDKNNIERMQMNAEGFKAAANYLDQAISKNGVFLGVYGPAYTANLAFACELYLKQLLLLTGKKQIGHELKSLYQYLNDDTKAQIKRAYEKKCEEFYAEVDNNVELRDLDSCLEAYNKAFEDWRYWYEGGKSSDCIGWKDFHILIETLDELIEKLIQ